MNKRMDLMDRVAFGCALASMVISAIDGDWTETMAWTVVALMSIRILYNNNNKSL